MNVTYDLQAFTRQRVGGISQLFADLFAAFLRYPNLAVTPQLPRHPVSTLALRSVSARLRGPILPRRIPRGAAYLSYWLTSGRPQPKADIVHYSYYSRRFLPRHQTTIYAVTVYDMIPELFRGTTNFTKTHLHKKDYVFGADLVICISESTKNDLIECWGPPPGQLVVVPAAVNDTFRPGASRLAGLPLDYVLYVGRREGYKNFALLLEAARNLKANGLDLPLVVAGPPISRTERKLINSMGLAERVLRIAPTLRELRQAYSNALVHVQTSSYEGFGLPPIEALACGVPTVVARTSAMIEVGGTYASFFEPNDAESLATEIRMCVEDPSRARLARELGPRWADNFSQRHLAVRTAAAYSSVLA